MPKNPVSGVASSLKQENLLRLFSPHLHAAVTLLYNSLTPSGASALLSVVKSLLITSSSSCSNDPLASEVSSAPTKTVTGISHSRADVVLTPAELYESLRLGRAAVMTAPRGRRTGAKSRRSCGSYDVSHSHYGYATDRQLVHKLAPRRQRQCSESTPLYSFPRRHQRQILDRDPAL